jgi:hypothetical protein
VEICDAPQSLARARVCDPYLADSLSAHLGDSEGSLDPTEKRRVCGLPGWSATTQKEVVQMPTRTILNRIERAEQAAKAQSRFLPDCICFPRMNRHSSAFPSRKKLQPKVQCPLHGARFKQPIFHIYVGKWRREGEPLRRQRLSPQYRKAWDASFPPELWPAPQLLQSR